MNSLSIVGVKVRQDAEGRYSLNDLHKAAVEQGANKRTKEPGKFLSSPQTIGLIDELTTQNVGSLPMTKVEGRAGGTFVCKELVYAYAMWISPSFHLRVIQAYDALAKGRLNRGLIMIKLMQGDCLERMKEIKTSSIDLVLVDPPYDIKNTQAGGKSNLAKSMQVMNDQIKAANIVSGFDIKVLDELVRVNKNINMYFFCNKAQLPMYIDYFVTQKKCSFDLIKWVKTNAMPTYHNKYLSDTEYCFYARKSGYCMPENYDDASTLYSAPINAKDKKKYNHPTIKPIALLEKLIRNSSKKGQTVLDCFMGSGSTGVACVNTGRKFIGIELDENYFNIAKQRIEEAQELHLTGVFVV